MFVKLILLFINYSFAFQVVLDPGHGGTDRGAVRGNTVESKIALSVSQKIALKLKEQGLQVIETRNSDITLHLKDRVEKAEKNNPDVFVSIHVNSSEDPKAKGAEFYFNPSETNTSVENNNSDKLADNIIKDYQYSRKLFQSKKLATAIAQQWQDSFSTTDSSKRRKVLQAPFYVVSKTKVPSILIELGFLSHPSESKQLINDDYQKQLAGEITDGILLYIKSTHSRSLYKDNIQ